jgi:hypothetical protein
MGTKWLAFKWHILCGMKRGGRGNGCGMRCGAQGSDSMAGQSRGGAGRRLELAVEALPCFGAKGGRRGRVGQKAKQADGVVGPIGPEVFKKNPFGIKNEFLNLQSLWKFVQGDLGGISI